MCGCVSGCLCLWLCVSVVVWDCVGVCNWLFESVSESESGCVGWGCVWYSVVWIVSIVVDVCMGCLVSVWGGCVCCLFGVCVCV